MCKNCDISMDQLRRIPLLIVLVFLTSPVSCSGLLIFQRNLFVERRDLHLHVDIKISLVRQLINYTGLEEWSK